jgi:hypothetical protein
MWPNPFLSELKHKLYREKSGLIFCATFVIFKKLPKVNIRPIGENSPNLVALDPGYGLICFDCH